MTPLVYFLGLRFILGDHVCACVSLASQPRTSYNRNKSEQSWQIDFIFFFLFPESRQREPQPGLPITFESDRSALIKFCHKLVQLVPRFVCKWILRPNVNVLVAALEIQAGRAPSGDRTNLMVKTNYFWLRRRTRTESGILRLQIWFLFNFLEFHTMILVMDSELKFRILFR